MAVKEEEMRELETARRYNFFEEFCCKGKERNMGKGKLQEEGSKEIWVWGVIVFFYEERMLIWYWEREGEIHGVVEREGLPAALHLTDWEVEMLAFVKSVESSPRRTGGKAEYEPRCW